MVNYFRLPGDFYATSLPEKMKKDEAKQWVRKWIGVTRLPNGTEFWL